MSWDIVVFNSTQKIKAIEELDENQLKPTDFCSILESSFMNVLSDDNHREIKGKDFSIDFFMDKEEVSNKLLSLYGEHGLFELIELAKKHNWQIYDSGLNEMIDLENPHNNGYENHRKYIEHIKKS